MKARRSATHKALFDTTLPFRAKVERDRKKFVRHSKHKGREL
jgi:stalled ribosome alternative rescue factor ArfA